MYGILYVTTHLAKINTMVIHLFCIRVIIFTCHTCYTLLRPVISNIFTNVEIFRHTEINM